MIHLEEARDSRQAIEKLIDYYEEIERYKQDLNKQQEQIIKAVKYYLQNTGTNTFEVAGRYATARRNWGIDVVKYLADIIELDLLQIIEFITTDEKNLEAKTIAEEEVAATVIAEAVECYRSIDERNIRFWRYYNKIKKNIIQYCSEHNIQKYLQISKRELNYIINHKQDYSKEQIDLVNRILRDGYDNKTFTIEIVSKGCDK